MNGGLSANGQAILLLTAPLLVGRSPTSVKPLPLGAYNSLVRHLRDAHMQPADLLHSEGLRELDNSWSRLGIRRTLEDVYRLLDRGFLVAHALERWGARAIWVVTRADDDYPSRLKRKMKGKAPPVLYGCGERGCLDEGGLAVVGSRNVNDELVDYAERIGQLAAEADVPIVSGGARGVDQAAMRGSLKEGGRAVGVLGNGLERAALHRGNREPLMDGRLVMVSSFDPAVRFRGWQAMERNKQIYALADAALVVKSDHGHGGTWTGATEQLDKLGYVPVYVRRGGEPCAGLDALVERDARPWPEPKDPSELQALLCYDESPVSRPIEPTDDLPLFASEHEAGPGVSAVREGVPTESDHKSVSEPGYVSQADGPVPGELPMRLLREMSGEMTRKDILAALGLRSRGNLKERYLDPCLGAGWIEMTTPEKPRSPKQRFRITAAGRAQIRHPPGAMCRTRS